MNFRADADVPWDGVLTLIGLLAAAVSLWWNTKADRGRFLIEIFNAYPDNKTVRKIHRQIDEGNFREWREEKQARDEKTGDDKNEERDDAMWDLLTYYDHIAYLCEQGIFRKKLGRVFERDRKALSKSPGVAQYISKRQGSDQASPFPFLSEWMKERT